MKLKEAMKIAKATGKRVKVTESTPVTGVKVNTSIRIDLEILNWCKKQAEQKGIPYTTLINSILKKEMRGEAGLEARVTALEKALKKAGSR